MDATLSDAHVHALAREILDRPRYANFRPSQFELLRWMIDAWRVVMDWLQHLHELNAPLFWLLLVGLCTLTALLLAHLVSTLREVMRDRPPAPPDEVRQPEHDFLQEARELAGADRHLEAAHLLLLENLRALAEGRHIPLQPEDGNRAVCRQLDASKLPRPLREQLIALILETEQAWFGSERGAEDVGQALYRRWDRVTSQVAQVTPP